MTGLPFSDASEPCLRGARMRTTMVAAFLCLIMIPSLALAQTLAASASDSAPPDVGRWTIGVEALLWWFKDSPAPTPLVSTGPLNAPGSSVILGGEDLDTNPNPGFRLTTGHQVTERWGVDGNVFYLPTRST